MKNPAHVEPTPRQSQAALYILAFIMLVNALAYGTIIPLLYKYTQRFGLDPVGLSFLFAGFSLAQFLATPILGRLSDRYGRKPVLLICLFGTGISLAMFASATNLFMLFTARIIDGVTGGNISVAQAMIADTTKGNDRAKAFGLLGAAFGIGFLAGPAIGGFASQFGLAAPFWFSSALAFIGTALGAIILKETLPKTKRQVVNKPLFNFSHLFSALFHPLTGLILLISFIAAASMNAFIIGIQSYTNDVLRMTPPQIGMMFSALGVVNILAQGVGIRILLNKVHNKKMIVLVSCLLSSVALVFVGSHSLIPLFIVNLIIFSVLLSPVVPVITGLLSERVKSEDQGGIMGINQSYTSLGQIVGPLIAGAISARFSISAIFVVAGAILFSGATATLWLKPVPKQKFDL